MSEARTNRRRYPRVKIAFPVRVKGLAADGKPWEAIGTSEDASLGGVAMRLGREVRPGEVLHLSMPMPPHLRFYDDKQPGFAVYAVVKGVLAFDESWRVRLVLHGRQAPRSASASAEAAQPAERRHGPRYDIFVNLRLSRLAANGGESELTVTENMGAAGARVPTTLPVSPGETLTISDDGGFRTEATACGLYTGSDRVRRVNLSFRDHAPARLIQA
jgi:hypothetical protein